LCPNSFWCTLRKITCCQVVNQLIERITRRKLLSSKFCQTLCSPWTLGTLQSWHCLTCQLLLTASTTQRCSNVCKRLMVLEDLSLSGLHRICITVLSMCSNLQAGRLSPQCHMKCHRVRFSDQFCSYFTLLTCCSLCKDIISIHTHMLTTHKSMDLVIRLTPAHFSSIYQIVSTMCHSRCRPTGCN